jgi:hypothetical protein
MRDRVEILYFTIGLKGRICPFHNIQSLQISRIKDKGSDQGRLLSLSSCPAPFPFRKRRNSSQKKLKIFKIQSTFVATSLSLHHFNDIPSNPNAIWSRASETPDRDVRFRQYSDLVKFYSIEIPDCHLHWQSCSGRQKTKGQSQKPIPYNPQANVSSLGGHSILCSDQDYPLHLSTLQYNSGQSP